VLKLLLSQFSDNESGTHQAFVWSKTAVASFLTSELTHRSSTRVMRIKVRFRAEGQVAQVSEAWL